MTETILGPSSLGSGVAFLVLQKYFYANTAIYKVLILLWFAWSTGELP